MNNLKKVKAIIDKLEKGHINLYHDISKEEIDEYIKNIDWDNLDDVDFDREMLKLFHQFKDAHTGFYINKNKILKYSNNFQYVDQKAYIEIDNKYFEILSINEMPIEEVLQKFSELITYETKEWRDNWYSVMLKSAYRFKMIGLSEDGVLNLKIKRDDSVLEYTIIPMSKEETDKQRRSFSPYYEYKVLEDNVLYLRYSKCANMEEFAFADLVKEIEKRHLKDSFTSFILDLRDNDGGNSKIIKPFYRFVEKNNLLGCMLINNGVFSSGRFAIADFKRGFKTITIGESTGGAAKSYGYNQPDSVEDCNFGYSIRLWDFSDIFGSEGSIKPDIEVKNTIETIEKGDDIQLKAAIEYLQQQKELLNNGEI